MLYMYLHVASVSHLKYRGEEQKYVHLRKDLMRRSRTGPRNAIARQKVVRVDALRRIIYTTHHPFRNQHPFPRRTNTRTSVTYTD